MKHNAGFLALIMLIAASTAAWSQDAGTELRGATVFARFPSALGAYACSSTTGGLTYQRWLGPLGLEATAGAIIGTSGNFDYNVQGAVQYMLYGEDFADWFSGALYANALVAHRGQSYDGTALAYIPSFHLGFGVGMEMVLLRHISTSLEFMYVGSLPLELAFAVGGSLKYRF